MRKLGFIDLDMTILAPFILPAVANYDGVRQFSFIDSELHHLLYLVDIVLFCHFAALSLARLPADGWTMCMLLFRLYRERQHRNEVKDSHF